MASAVTTITVSVPPYLKESLVELERCGEDIPISLRETVEDFLNSIRDGQRDGASTPEIGYETLHQISRWAQSEAGKSSLRSHGLDASDYLLISLLSGVTSSPSTNPPPYDPDEFNPNKTSRRAAQDRRAIVALLNALFSILGVGIGSFWIAGSAGWKLEHRTIFALFASIVIAATEGALYLIWSNRTNQKRSRRGLRRRSDLLGQISSKKDDGPDEPTPANVATDLTTDSALGVRRRTGIQTADGDAVEGTSI